jgi:mRNA interferase MazF
MVDKITTMPRTNLAADPLGRLRDDDVLRFNRALLVFFGLADTTAPEP